jgi:hypothetical protein
MNRFGFQKTFTIQTLYVKQNHGSGSNFEVTGQRLDAAFFRIFQLTGSFVLIKDSCCANVDAVSYLIDAIPENGFSI